VLENYLKLGNPFEPSFFVKLERRNRKENDQENIKEKNPMSNKNVQVESISNTKKDNENREKRSEVVQQEEKEEEEEEEEEEDHHDHRDIEQHEHQEAKEDVSQSSLIWENYFNKVAKPATSQLLEEITPTDVYSSSKKKEEE